MSQTDVKTVFDNTVRITQTVYHALQSKGLKDIDYPAIHILFTAIGIEPCKTHEIPKEGQIISEICGMIDAGILVETNGCIVCDFDIDEKLHPGYRHELIPWRVLCGLEEISHYTGVSMDELTTELYGGLAAIGMPNMQPDKATADACLEVYHEMRERYTGEK